MASPSYASGPAPDDQPAAGAEFPPHAEAVARMRRLNEGTDQSADSWLEYCEEREIFHLPTREFVTQLADIILRLDGGGGECVEIAAGSGKLAYGLAAEGVDIVPTDRRGDDLDVQRLDAIEALRQHNPHTVLACWPPLGAGVERAVTRKPDVKHFIYIGQLINQQVGIPEMWSNPRWQYRELSSLLKYSICRYDYYSTVRDEVVRHSRPFHLFTESGDDIDRY